MFNKIKSALGLDPIQKKLDDLIGKVPAINALEDAFERLSDEELSAKTAEFRSHLADKETLDELLPEDGEESGHADASFELVASVASRIREFRRGTLTILEMGRSESKLYEQLMEELHGLTFCFDYQTYKK